MPHVPWPDLPAAPHGAVEENQVQGDIALGLSRYVLLGDLKVGASRRLKSGEIRELVAATGGPKLESRC